jgi:hypothetical protein
MQVLLISLLSLISVGLYPLKEDSWRLFSSAEGLFSAAMPDEPKTNLIVTDTSRGQLLTHVTSATDKEGNEYLISWTQYESGKDERKATPATFDRIRDGLVASKHGKILAEPEISFNGHPARAVSLTDSEGRLVQARFYFVKNRFYQVMAETKTQGNSTSMNRFLDSFKIVEP